VSSLRQRTIRTTATVSGPLLHASGSGTVVFSPATEDTGWVFIRSDLPGNPQIPCRPENVDVRYRWTTVRRGEASVSVVEHVLAACRGLEIDNLLISVDTDGIPMPDGGSAKPFVDALLDARIICQAKPRNFFIIDRPVFVAGSRGDPMTEKIASSQSYIVTLPGNGFEVIYVLEYPNTPLGTQIVKFDVNPDVFVREIAPARSFITSWELNRLQNEQATALFGPAIDEVPIVHPNRNFVQRLSLEAARHKALDLVGDLALLGRPIQGTFIGIRSGHRLNRELVLSLAHQFEEANL